MEEKKQELTTEQKLRNELNNVTAAYKQLMYEADQMRMALSNYQRLDYILNIISLSDKGMFSSDFLLKCSEEVENAVCPPEENKEEEEMENADRNE